MSEWKPYDSGEITLGGQWDAGDDMFNLLGAPERDVTIIAQSHRVWRLDVYKQRTVFRAGLKSTHTTNEDGLTSIECSIVPRGFVRIERAEWWRLALWYLCAPVRWIQSMRPEPPQ